MPTIVFDIFDILAALFRFLGLVVFGLGAGWFTLQAFRNEAWQVQIAAFLGFAGTAIAMAAFLTAGALGGFGLGAGAAMLIWGMQKDKKEEDED